MKRWLAMVRHDLLKHPLWPARDLVERAEAGMPPRAEELAAAARAVLEVPDEEGQEVGIAARWRALRALLPSLAAQQPPAPPSVRPEPVEGRVPTAAHSPPGGLGANGSVAVGGGGDGANVSPAALDAFAAAIARAEAAARTLAGDTAGDWRAALAAILALDEAFARLARDLNLS